MLVYAIVVTYNGMKWYDRCLGSLRNSEQKVLTIVIDNLSTDGTVEYIKKKYPEVHIIESSENLGFAKANNIGIRYAIDHCADYVFLLNQDAWIEKDTLSKLVKTFEENTDAGIVSPIHLNGSCTGLDWGFASYMKPDFVSDLYMKQLKSNYEVSFVNAAAWLISIECIRKVGGFDTSLFIHYGEDDNYCQRLAYHGFKIFVCTQSTICHDREFRKGQEMEYRRKMLAKNPFLQEKLRYGDINHNYDLDKMIRKEYQYMLKSAFLLSKKAVAYHHDMIDVLKEIKFSREENLNPNMSWLKISL